jgi:hypothetical protein
MRVTNGGTLSFVDVAKVAHFPVIWKLPRIAIDDVNRVLRVRALFRATTDSVWAVPLASPVTAVFVVPAGTLIVRPPGWTVTVQPVTGAPPSTPAVQAR